MIVPSVLEGGGGGGEGRVKVNHYVKPKGMRECINCNH